MIDKDEYPQTAEIEERCVHMLADLWNSPDAANTLGTSTTGSSEAAMLGGMALKWKWRERRRAAGKPTDKPNLVTGPVQICWHKFARYWDVEHPRDPDGRRPADHDARGGRQARATRTRSASCRRSGSPSPASTSRSRRSAKRWTSCKRRPGSTFRFTSMRPAADSWRRSSSRNSCGISACRA